MSVSKFEDSIVVIPAFNEANTIGEVVKRVKSVLDNVVVVDDCSSDDTGRLATAAGAVVVRHSQNQGYDNALLSGFSYASQQGFRWMATFDADGQHDIESLQLILSSLSRGDARLVLGRRPKPARVSEALFAAYANMRFGVKDPLCGLKGYCVELFKRAVLVHKYNSIGSVLALESIRNNASFLEIPIQISERQGTSRLGRSLKANWVILKALTNTIRYLR